MSSNGLPKLLAEPSPGVADANGNIQLPPEELQQMEQALEQHFTAILRILRIDPNDPNSADTPRRLARMWVRELLRGRYEPPPRCTLFPNRRRSNALVMSRGIEVRSVCSHHWQPIIGQCVIGYVPGEHIIGLSKLNRIVEWFSRRGQVQEELTEQIAEFLQGKLRPRALGVVLACRHYCMIVRGVEGDEEQAVMVTSTWRGGLAENTRLREEFFRLAGMELPEYA
ncbi:MAG: GTP cyclohydrolase I [Candidatus Kapabacteria bacterium]|nr:GTP cyclohydrolase I [Candidatus Kapabacteria bacterium]MCS7169375.1 GTP cyclohydrolase I [Candidatus Kapabacteria bacterium]MDW7996790.1 GTP cyclohydrolase I [Bacteroidota bacterium]MDW8225128.1 GTP cyclohydrolase I [Bacteroidota bacterium]